MICCTFHSSLFLFPAICISTISQIVLFNRTAAEAKVSADKLVNELNSSMAWEESALEVIKQVWNSQVRRNDHSFSAKQYLHLY